ncbi:MAG: T9SS type A sorting domain-containing protein [bacterium]|nr:T9SS type A sorting domain-containing protein [bacterium]
MAPAPFILTLLLLITGSAAAARPLVVAAGDSLVLEGATLTASRTRPAALVQGTLILRDCVVEGKAGGASLLVCEGHEARLVVERCRLWARPRSRWAGWAKAPDDAADTRPAKRTALPPLVELRGGHAELSSSTLWALGDGPLVQVAAGATARLASCLLGGGGPAAIQAEDARSVELAWCLGDRAAPPDAPARAGHRIVSDLGLVDPRRGDFHLRWNSPALDAGDPAAPLDFDLTRPDIGWTPTYPVTPLSGVHQGPLERGWYEVVEDCAILDEDLIIPDGTVIRVTPGKTLSLSAQGAPSNGYHIQVGDLEGARTALVGKTDLTQQTGAAAFHFGSSATYPHQAEVTFNGVLFHYAPEGGLYFTHSDVDLDGETSRFSHYRNRGLQFYNNCVGRVADFDFRGSLNTTEDTLGVGFLDIYNSAVDVVNCQFEAMAGSFPSSIFQYNSCLGREPVISHCRFQGVSAYALEAHLPVYLFNVTSHQHHNLYDNLSSGAMWLTDTYLHMNNGAVNRFFRRPDYDRNWAIIQGYPNSAYVDMECGYNAFVDYRIQEPPYRNFIEGSCAGTDWNNNYWGTTCYNTIPPQGLIPSYAVANTNLSTCYNAHIPCPGQGGEIPLYLAGKGAADVGNFEAAVTYWIQFLVDHPVSAYALSVAGLVKSIGLTTPFGADAYDSIRLGLEAAAVAAEPTDPHLAIFELCSGLCVEAWHGDRAWAVDALDSLASLTKDPADAKTIEAAQLEIQTYPPQGQTSALGAPLAQVGRTLALQRSLASLRQTLIGGPLPAAAPEDGAAPGRPRRLGIASCHPNPFNPATSIEIDLPEPAQLTLRVHNIQGQWVGTLCDEGRPAGRHAFRFDGGHLGSGLYFVRAEASGQVATTKIMLVK